MEGRSVKEHMLRVIYILGQRGIRFPQDIDYKGNDVSGWKWHNPQYVIICKIANDFLELVIKDSDGSTVVKKHYSMAYIGDVTSFVTIVKEYI